LEGAQGDVVLFAEYQLVYDFAQKKQELLTNHIWYFNVI